ncbi:MAG TPA: hypothetical protein VFV23_04890 [Verrucomicrobiae bacterium]|nr:hypothetical protein [Verrucomicrobiae bacterium]
MKLFDDKTYLSEIRGVSINNSKLIAFDRNISTGNLVPNNCVYSPQRIVFDCDRLIENQYFYQIHTEGKIDNILIQKIEPKDNGFVVLANFLPQ